MQVLTEALTTVLTRVLAMTDCGTIDGDPVMCPDDPFGSDMDSGIPGFFVLFFILAILMAVGGALYRMSAARDMATKAGMDPQDAAKVALLDEHGVAAAYVMSNLNKPDEAPAAAAAADRTVEQRLAELQSLLDRGLVTQAEYDEQRAEILDSI